MPTRKRAIEAPDSEPRPQRLMDLRPAQCETAGVDLELDLMPPPVDLADPDRIKAAGALMLIHQYATRMGFFAAIERARVLLDEDKLRLDFGDGESDLLNTLYCWPRLNEGLDPRTVAAVKARVLGIAHDDVSESDRNQSIGPLLARLVEALNVAREPTAAQLFDLERARRAVRTNLTQHTSAGAMLVVKHLKANFTTAQRLLEQLAEHLPAPRYLDAGGALRSVVSLVGDDLRAGGVNLAEAYDVAVAWQTLFGWLSTQDDPALAPGEIGDGLWKAAATLRPAR
jgi:hypothetical protein